MGRNQGMVFCAVPHNGVFKSYFHVLETSGGLIAGTCRYKTAKIFCMNRAMSYSLEVMAVIEAEPDALCNALQVALSFPSADFLSCRT